jgi:alpha-mannosidase
MAKRVPIGYCFGNHMHWVDMEWLWGYHVLPGSVRDMLRYCAETGAKGCVNFDGVGYEKMAAEAPEALAELRSAIQEGTIEPVGCSYGQPYGLFHGGESNVRQRVYGVRTAMRLLGARPKTFWEEEFDFFPQLPQILARCGFEFASLFFQWTWHTPEIPIEDVPVAWWEAPDGSRILTATRNRLNLHQWPEEYDSLLEELAALHPPLGAKREKEGAGSWFQGEEGSALILQWLELMPSPDWMCRSELIAPILKKLLADKRFDVRMWTLAEYLSAMKARLSEAGSGSVGSAPSSSAPETARDVIPLRSYQMHQVWHGVSLGKNGDELRRASRDAECALLHSESLSAILGLFGRPYAQWDVYPVWELDEAWRELFQAQHHDNDECEGLCGRIGRESYRRSRALAKGVQDSQISMLTERGGGNPTHGAAVNMLGWPRDVSFVDKGGRETYRMPNVPAFGWNALPLEARIPVRLPAIETRDGYAFEIGDDRTQLVLEGEGAPSLVLPGGLTARLSEIRCATPEGVCRTSSVSQVDVDERLAAVWLTSPGWPSADWASVVTFIEPGDSARAVRFAIHCHPIQGEPEPGMNAGWQIPFSPEFPVARILADVPYGTYEVQPSGARPRKYPKGDWMTSEQWFEEVMNPFTALSFVDFLAEDGSGVLLAHDGTQQWFLDEGGAVRALAGMMDPWDENKATASCEALFCAFRHGPIAHSDRHRLSMAFRASLGPLSLFELNLDESVLPAPFSAMHCSAANVLATAFYREDEFYSGRDLENYAGRGMGHPFVLRLVEFDGITGEAEITLPGPIAKAFKTNLMGEIEAELKPRPGKAPPGNSPEAVSRFEWQNVTVQMRAHEIATLYLDIVPGRKQTRDLDAKRQVWAGAHRAGRNAEGHSPDR